MSDGWAGFIAEHRVEESPAEKMARLAHQAEARADRRAGRDEAERHAAVEDERDRRLFQYQQLGIAGRSVADLTADASRAADEDDQYQEALKTIQRIDKRRASRAEALRFQAEQLASVSRSRQTTVTGGRDLLADAKRTMAEVRRSGRPFDGKAVTRSEALPDCAECRKVGATREQSFLIHQDPAPPPVPEGWTPPEPYCRGCGSLSSYCVCSSVRARYGGQVITR